MVEKGVPRPGMVRVADDLNNEGSSCLKNEGNLVRIITRARVDMAHLKEMGNKRVLSGMLQIGEVLGEMNSDGN